MVEWRRVSDAGAHSMHAAGKVVQRTGKRQAWDGQREALAGGQGNRETGARRSILATRVDR
jgi:hypothetical protein